MGVLGDRITTLIESWTELWKERMRGFAISIIQLGLEALLNALEKAAAPHLKPFIERMEETGEVPEELKPLFKELKEPTGAWPAMMGLALGSGVMGSAIGTLGDVMFGSMARSMMKKVTTRIMEVMPLIVLYRRGDITPDDFYGWMAENGFDRNWTDWWLKATEFLPSWGDLIHWQAREVFEEAMVKKYGLDDEFETLDLTLFAKIGVSEEQAKNAWRAHWEHASWMQVVEMLHRGLITEDEIWDWFRLVEIPPFWRKLLISIAYTWPTRVDVRRWWDMRTIDEKRLRELYAGMGYHGDNLDDYVRWTKVYVDFPVMMTRFRNGWITEKDVRDWLSGLEIPEDRIDQFIEEKTKPEKPDRTVKERDLTKTDIVKGVKEEVITRDQGLELLMDLGYDEDEADFILASRIVAEAGSPETYEEFKDLTQKYRRAVGREAKAMPEELKQAGAKVVELTTEVESLQRAIADEEAKLVKEEVLPEAATKKLDELRVSLHRAEAKLARAKSKYDRLLAEWKHGG